MQSNPFFQHTHLKPITYEAYNRKLTLWLSLFPPSHQTLVFLYISPNYAVAILRRHLVTTQSDTAVTINSYIKAIMAAQLANADLFSSVSAEKMATCDARWRELRQKTYEEAFSYRMQAKPSPLQALHTGVDLSFTDLVEKRDSLPDGSTHKLLLGFYTHIPPVRADYFATQIIPFGVIPDEPNYIHHSAEKSHLVITDFKTSRLYKKIIHDLPEELHIQLVESLKTTPRKYLFVNKFGEPFNRYTFSHWANQQLETIFKKGLTLTMLRHIFISTIDFNQSTPEQLQKIGNQMGHNVSQQLLYKWKINANQIIEEDSDSS
jgi:hypothetical protein